MLVMKCQGLVVFAGDPPGDSVLVPMDLLPVGVVFFPSLLFMGVVLFPSFVLGNTSGEGGTFFVSLFLFSPPLFLPLLSSHSPSFSVSLLLFLLFLLLPIFFLFPFTLSLSFFLFPLFFSLSFAHPLSLPFCFVLFCFVLRELLVLFISEM